MKKHSGNHYGFTAEELRTFRRMRKPEDVQLFLDTQLGYNKEPDGPTCRSPRRVLRDRVAHCIEGALFAAAALRIQGYPPLIVDMEAVRDDDHIIAVFRENACWGAVAKSNYSGLRFREPVFRTIRELVMSYFEHYYNLAGEKSLRRFSKPVSLVRFDRLAWMIAERDLWEIGDYLCAIPHSPILTPTMIRKLRKVDERLYQAGLLGSI